MKKFLVLLSAFLLVITMTACGEKDSSIPEGMKLPENDIVDYYFYYPETWSLSRNDGMISAYVSEKDSSSVSITAFNSNQEVTSLDEYLAMDGTTYTEKLKSTFLDVEILSDGEETKLHDALARQFVFTANVGGETYKFRQIITFRFDYIYIMTYTSTLEGFDKHTDEVNKIVKEFKFK
ncbi:MAG: hypothetical protein E7613_04595 [Ruminococcaceae bacterium]|nr:hypothetical protein [Oscillospiraceae bacterium]